MEYSFTHHGTYNRIYFYSLNKAICLSTDIVVTGELINKLKAALKAKG